MRTLLAALLLTISALPAAAQMDPADAWSSQRIDFLNEFNQQTERFDGQRSNYLGSLEGREESWWSDWMSRQPYDGGASARTLVAPARGVSDSPTLDGLPTGGNSRNQSDRPVEPLPVQDMVRDDFEGLYPTGQ